MTDPYKVLGITRDATDDEVKKAYRNLSRKYHPDANVNNPNKDKAEEMFKLVQQAYDQIIDEREKGYSSYGGNSYGGSSYSGGFGGFGDFGGFGGYSHTSEPEDEETIRLKACANYIKAGHYQEALNVLDSISQKSAMWYYYSAVANSGAGNNVTALDHAQMAVNMDPYNNNYRELLNALQNGGNWYRSMGMPYGRAYNVSGQECGRLCINLLICNLCCGGGGFCCI